MAFVSTSHSQGNWNVGLSPKLPIKLTVESVQGTTSLDPHTLKIQGLQVTQERGDLNLKLSAATLNATLRQSQGSVIITLPPATSIRLKVKELTQDKLVMNAKTVAGGMKLDGTYQSANFESAKHRVNMAVMMELGDVSVN